MATRRWPSNDDSEHDTESKSKTDLEETAKRGYGRLSRGAVDDEGSNRG